MEKVNVRLQPLVTHLNLPTVLRTVILPGDRIERLLIATQVGEIFIVGEGEVNAFLDIRSRVIGLGEKGGYDERGLLGLAFHPEFQFNGLFYLHYSIAGSQGPGAPHPSFTPNPCDAQTLNLKWTDRENQYDHIDTVEEWVLQRNGQPRMRRTLLKLRRPFMNHNGVNSLNFSPETGKLVITTGDGGSGYDPYHLAQDPMEIAGKIIEIDVAKDAFIAVPPVVTRFDELPVSIQEMLTVIVKGVRNVPGISYQRIGNGFIKYVGNVGQDLVESVFSFISYQPMPVTTLVQAYRINSQPNEAGVINLGWRGWEGDFPSMFLRDCSRNPSVDEKIVAFYDETVMTSAQRIRPLVQYYHLDSRPDGFEGTALTGVQAYMGTGIRALTGSVVFTDFARKEKSEAPVRGVLAYSRFRMDGQPNEYSVIETDDPFGDEAAYYTSLGTNLDQTRLFLGVYGSSFVTDYHQGSVFEIVP